MSPFNDLTPSNKFRSRSVSDQKETISEKNIIESGARNDVIQEIILRKQEISEMNEIKKVEVEQSKIYNENDTRIFEENILSKKKENFVAKNSDNTFITHAKIIESTWNQANEPNMALSHGNNSLDSDSNDYTKSGNAIQPSKLPRPTSIGGLKNPHLPAANNNLPIHTDRHVTGNLNLETSKNTKTVNLNDTNITFEGVHFSVLSPENQRHLKEEQSHNACSQKSEEKGQRLNIENQPRLNKKSNVGKIEDDNANLSDEGIIIGDVNSNANSEASNSPLPPVSSNTEELNIEDGHYLNHKQNGNNQVKAKDDNLLEDVNCNNSRVPSERNNKLLDMNDDNLKQEALSIKCKQSSANKNDKIRNNNNDANVSTPSMSSPCDDRVPSRIPLSVE